MKLENNATKFNAPDNANTNATLPEYTPELSENTLLHGVHGSKKNMNFLMPYIMETDASFIIDLPFGESINSYCEKRLEEHGYNIITLRLNQKRIPDPFAYAKEDIDTFITGFINANLNEEDVKPVVEDISFKDGIYLYLLLKELVSMVQSNNAEVNAILLHETMVAVHNNLDKYPKLLELFQWHASPAEKLDKMLCILAAWIELIFINSKEIEHDGAELSPNEIDFSSFTTKKTAIFIKEAMNYNVTDRITNAYYIKRILDNLKESIQSRENRPIRVILEYPETKCFKTDAFDIAKSLRWLSDAPNTNICLVSRLGSSLEYKGFVNIQDKLTTMIYMSPSFPDRDIDSIESVICSLIRGKDTSRESYEKARQMIEDTDEKIDKENWNCQCVIKEGSIEITQKASIEKYEKYYFAPTE